MEGFGNQTKANHQQKAQAQHHHGGMLVHKIGEHFAGGNHHGHGNGNRRHRYDDVFHHRHGGNHAIYGKHGIQHHNLRHHTPKGGVFFVRVGNLEMVFAFQPLV